MPQSQAEIEYDTKTIEDKLKENNIELLLFLDTLDINLNEII